MADRSPDARRLTNLVHIDDPDDPRIEPYRNLRDRDLMGGHHGFMAEGEVVLRVLASSPQLRPSSVLIAERRLEKLRDVLGSIEPEAPVYVAGQGVIDRVVGFHIHRGILAFGERREVPGAQSLLASLRGDAVVVALFGVSNHDNVGGVFRNAAAFGASAVLLDEACCDPLYRKAIRVSVGASLITPYAWLAGDEDPLAMLERNGFRPVALTPRGNEAIADLTPHPRTALLVGSEGRGLSEDLQQRATTVRIPMRAGFDSLNLATASGIALHCLMHGLSIPDRPGEGS